VRDLDELLMRGTEGKRDYLRVLDVDCLTFAVKPLVVPTEVKTDDGGFPHPVLQTGLRVRAVRRADNVVVNVGSCVGAFFPEIEWGKLDSTRASAVLDLRNCWYYDLYSIESYMKQIVSENLEQWLLSADPLTFGDRVDFVDEEQLSLFLKRGVAKGLDDIWQIAAKSGVYFEKETTPQVDNVVSVDFGGKA
jgi:hypothetical protein